MDHYPGKTLVYPDIQYRVRIYKMNGKAEANWSFAEVCRKGGYGTKIGDKRDEEEITWVL